MYQCGTQNCEAGHYYGPAVRDHFLIHYIHNGKGKYCIGEKEYKLQKGQGFLICPDIVTFYQADYEDPWSYSWVGFHGLKAEEYLKSAGLTMDRPIFACDGDDCISSYFAQMMAAKSLQKGREIHLLGLLYLFLSQLIEQNGKDRLCTYTGNRKEVYIKKAIDYVEMNYSRKISIAELAHHIGLDRSYLGSVFKEQLDTSLQDFLINYRIDKACELMKNVNLSIGDISRSVGYDDPLQFSKLFKRTRSISPREYRKKLS
jgi:AraC-like DNA-binding protein